MLCEEGNHAMNKLSKPLTFLSALLLLLVAATSAFAQTTYTLTGTGIKVKTVAFVDVNQYSISHYMQQLPATKSKQAVIDLDTNKKFQLTMQRDIPRDEFITSLKNSFALNGYSDSTKIGQFLNAFKSDLKDKQMVSIVYD